MIPEQKIVVIDRKKSKIIKLAFELYAQNNSRLEDIADFLAQHSIVSRNGKHLTRDRISFILSNPFYVGLFKYASEIHEGKHQPVISKKIFDQVQTVLKQRSRPQDRKNSVPKPFGGLLKCSCGMEITAEIQKGYTYYRCSRKSKTINCKEPYIHQEELDRQISKLLQKFSLKKDWADKLLCLLEKDKNNTAQSFTAFVQETNERVSTIKIRLQRLLDGYL